MSETSTFTDDRLKASHEGARLMYPLDDPLSELSDSDVIAMRGPAMQYGPRVIDYAEKTVIGAYDQYLADKATFEEITRDQGEL